MTVVNNSSPREGLKRRLVFCFDGSWNKLDTKSHPTNVVLVAESITPIDREGTHQIVYYDEGVGTSSNETLRGGAFGKGLIQNIREAYRFLIFNHQVGDEIFVFGFSRGAFTARSFIGFVRLAGILKVNDANQINKAWNLYTKYASHVDDDVPEVLAFRAEYCPHVCITDKERLWRHENIRGAALDTPVLRIKYCGVWDTVGTLGWKAVSAVVDRRTDKRYQQHNTDLSDTVEAARHAVAIDERRVHFMPTLWSNVRSLNETCGKLHGQSDAPFQQKWFAGDHGSVGGGGPERGLSNAALQWVLKGAIDKGLEVKLSDRSQLRDIRYNARAPLQNTPAEGTRFAQLGADGVKAALGWLKRTLLTADRSGPEDIEDIHASALRRYFTEASALPETQPYRPKPFEKLTKEIAGLKNTYVPSEQSGTIYTQYTVKPGDSLSRIAEVQLQAASRTNEIFMLNRDLLDDPGDIFPGDVLRLPPLVGTPLLVAAEPVTDADAKNPIRKID